jgi:hypothetical protein
MALVKCNHCGKDTRNDNPLFLGKCTRCGKELGKDITKIERKYSKKEAFTWTCLDCSSVNNNNPIYVCEKCYSISKSHLPLIIKLIKKEQSDKHIPYTNTIAVTVWLFLFFLSILIFESLPDITVQEKIEFFEREKKVYENGGQYFPITQIVIFLAALWTRYRSMRLFEKRVNKNLEYHLRNYKKLAKEILVNVKDPLNAANQAYYLGLRQNMIMKLHS